MNHTVIAAELYPPADRNAELADLVDKIWSSYPEGSRPDKDLVAREVAAVDKFHEGFGYDDENLWVETDEIELGDFDLGRFAVRLPFVYLGRDGSHGRLRADALDPHPSAKDETVTHPHVRGGDVCLGNSYGAFHAAVSQGRLCDALDVAIGVLNEYNPESPYVLIEGWDEEEPEPEPSCHDCGRETDDTCERCFTEVCGRCSFSCSGCGEHYTCENCETRVMSRCACGELKCDGCQFSSADGSVYCETCRPKETEGELDEEDEEDDEDDEDA